MLARIIWACVSLWSSAAFAAPVTVVETGIVASSRAMPWFGIDAAGHHYERTWHIETDVPGARYTDAGGNRMLEGGSVFASVGFQTPAFVSYEITIDGLAYASSGSYWSQIVLQHDGTRATSLTLISATSPPPDATVPTRYDFSELANFLFDIPLPPAGSFVTPGDFASGGYMPGSIVEIRDYDPGPPATGKITYSVGLVPERLQIFADTHDVPAPSTGLLTMVGLLCLAWSRRQIRDSVASGECALRLISPEQTSIGAVPAPRLGMTKSSQSGPFKLWRSSMNSLGAKIALLAFSLLTGAGSRAELIHIVDTGLISANSVDAGPEYWDGLNISGQAYTRTIDIDTRAPGATYEDLAGVRALTGGAATVAAQWGHSRNPSQYFVTYTVQVGGWAFSSSGYWQSVIILDHDALHGWQLVVQSSVDRSNPAPGQLLDHMQLVLPLFVDLPEYGRFIDTGIYTPQIPDDGTNANAFAVDYYDAQGHPHQSIRAVMVPTQFLVTASGSTGATVPEPSTLALLFIGLLTGLLASRSTAVQRDKARW